MQRHICDTVKVPFLKINRQDYLAGSCRSRRQRWRQVGLYRATDGGQFKTGDGHSSRKAECRRPPRPAVRVLLRPMAAVPGSRRWS